MHVHIRVLNKITMKNQDALQNIVDVLDMFQGENYLCKLDLKFGYN
jgi:hypothetical protein